MHKILGYIACLCALLALWGCPQGSPAVEWGGVVYAPHSATGFEIVATDGASTVLRVLSPWQGAEGVLYYTTLNPDKPAQRVVAMSSSYVAMLDAVGCADRIVGISGCRFISTPSACKAIEEGRIAEVGFDSTFDFERIKSLNADIVLLYGVAGEAKTFTNKLDELSIPYIYI